jgi:hypothetical protein
MNIDLIKNKLEKLQKGYEPKEKVDYTKIFWKPKSAGKYQVRFVPSPQNTNPESPFMEIFVHYGLSKFPILALTNWKEKDPIVEFAKKLRKEDDPESWALAKKIEPKMRIYAPVLVRGEEDKGVRLWEFGKETYMQLLGIADDEDYGDYTDVNEGRDFTIEAVDAVIVNRKGLKCSLIAKPKTTPLSKDPEEVKLWLDEQPDLLSVRRKYEFDELKTILQDWLDKTEDEEDEEEPEAMGSDEDSDDDFSNVMSSDELPEDGSTDYKPWKKDSPKKDYKTKGTPNASSAAKSAKFSALFEDEE